MFQYFIKIVPTVYEDIYGSVISTNQFSVTEHQRSISPNSHGGLPGVFFSYELSPIMVKFTEYRQGLAHFLTSMCAIIGGIFTIAGLVDSFIYHGVRSLKKKIELGKDT
jgi:endoplasmic reticulum-Golgi intermediate compartment protein 3